jgi:hypothetical protein
MVHGVDFVEINRYVQMTIVKYAIIKVLLAIFVQMIGVRKINLHLEWNS